MSAVCPWTRQIDEGDLRFDFLEDSNVRGELGRIALGDGFEADRRAAYVTVHEGGLPRLDYEAETITARDSVGGRTRPVVPAIGFHGVSVWRWAVVAAHRIRARGSDAGGGRSGQSVTSVVSISGSAPGTGLERRFFWYGDVRRTPRGGRLDRGQREAGRYFMDRPNDVRVAAFLRAGCGRKCRFSHAAVHGALSHRTEQAECRVPPAETQ